MGFIGFNVKDSSVQIWDGGNTRWSTTNLPTIGKAIVSILSTPERLSATENKYIYISSHTTTQNELLAIYEKATGKKWQTENVDSKEAGEKALAAFKGGDFSVVGTLIKTAFLASDQLGDWEKRTSNNLLGLPKEDLEADVKGVIARASS